VAGGYKAAAGLNEVIIRDNPDYYAGEGLSTGLTRATVILSGKGYWGRRIYDGLD